MSAQALRLFNKPIQLQLISSVYRSCMVKQVALNSSMAAMGLGIYSGLSRFRMNEDFTKITSVTIAQLSIMQPIYNNIIFSVQEKLNMKSKPASLIPPLNVFPLVAIREGISIGMGFCLSSKLKERLINKNMSENEANFTASFLVGTSAAVISHPVHNIITHHMASLGRGETKSLLANTTELLKRNKLSIVSRGLVARASVVFPSILAMNFFLEPLYKKSSVYES